MIKKFEIIFLVINFMNEKEIYIFYFKSHVAIRKITWIYNLRGQVKKNHLLRGEEINKHWPVDFGTSTSNPTCPHQSHTHTHTREYDPLKDLRLFEIKV